MLYSEFIEGTGCRDNEHNMKVYKDLEIMYMNSDMSKEEIYEYGKKLVDNSKPQKIIDLENEIKSQIEDLKKQIEDYKEMEEMYTVSAKRWEEMGEKEMAKMDRSGARWNKEQAKECRRRIRELRWVLA